MDGELGRLAVRQGGFAYTWQILDHGYRERDLYSLVRQGQWVRLRRGAFADRRFVEALTANQRHVLLARAVVGALEGPVVLTGHSALAVLDVPLWGVDLDEVQLVRREGITSRRQAGVAHFAAPLRMDDVQLVDRLACVRPERALVDACRFAPFEAAVVLADGVRRCCSTFDIDRAEHILEEQRSWSGSVTASRALHFSNPLAESVGESRTRVLLARVGAPAPLVQHRILSTRTGALIAIADMYVKEHRTVVEFDGKIKYGRALYESQGQADVDLGDVVWREKRREDEIRDEGHEVVRVVWSDLEGNDARVALRLSRAFGPQFELNRFLRDWNAAHPGAGRDAALAAWRDHRSRPVDDRPGFKGRGD
jgi:hypothetical protein